MKIYDVNEKEITLDELINFGFCGDAYNIMISSDYFDYVIDDILDVLITDNNIITFISLSHTYTDIVLCDDNTDIDYIETRNTKLFNYSLTPIEIRINYI